MNPRDSKKSQAFTPTQRICSNMFCNLWTQRNWGFLYTKTIRQNLIESSTHPQTISLAYIPVDWAQLSLTISCLCFFLYGGLQECWYSDVLAVLVMAVSLEIWINFITYACWKLLYCVLCFCNVGSFGNGSNLSMFGNVGMRWHFPVSYLCNLSMFLILYYFVCFLWFWFHLPRERTTHNCFLRCLSPWTNTAS